MCRIVNLKNGSIIIDGHDIRDVGLEVLRSRLALVPQDSTLFMGTLRENLYVQFHEPMTSYRPFSTNTVITEIHRTHAPTRRSSSRCRGHGFFRVTALWTPSLKRSSVSTQVSATKVIGHSCTLQRETYPR